MANDQLLFTLIQPHIYWEEKEKNFQQYEQFLQQQKSLGIVVLPEMFQTGFSMKPKELAEPMDGPTINWMREMTIKYRCILAGSLMVQEGANFFNRLIWMQPDGNFHHYDKRHLFAFAGEDAHFSAGEKRVVVQVNGWKICLQVCYDLRFPVWSRNAADPYDVLIYVANWPEKRSYAWRHLLKARAIENMSYVIGVNRVGEDGHGYNHVGDSLALSPLGEPLLDMGQQVGINQVTLSLSELHQQRKELPFLQDADKFILL